MAIRDTSYQPSIEELKAAYHRARLWVRGISLDIALAQPLIRQGLEGNAKHYHNKETQARGHTLPTQGCLL